MSQEYVDKLKSLNLPMDTVVTLTYSDGCDVFLHNETEVEDALRNTDVVSRFCDLVFQLGGETQQSVIDEQLLRLKSVQSDLQDLDYAEAVSRMQKEMLGLEAAQSSFAQISRLSLFNYIGN